MAYLYKHTELSTTFNVNLTCLVPTANPLVGQPARLSLAEICRHFLDFRLEIVTRRLEHEKKKLEERLHILDGFAKIHADLDRALKIIRAAESRADAAAKLGAAFKLDSPPGRRDPGDPSLPARATGDLEDPEGAPGEARAAGRDRGSAEEAEAALGDHPGRAAASQDRLRRQAAHGDRARRGALVRSRRVRRSRGDHGRGVARRLGEARARAQGPGFDAPSGGRRALPGPRRQHPRPDRVLHELRRPLRSGGQRRPRDHRLRRADPIPGEARGQRAADGGLRGPRRDRAGRRGERAGRAFHGDGQAGRELSPGDRAWIRLPLHSGSRRDDARRPEDRAHVRGGRGRVGVRRARPPSGLCRRAGQDAALRARRGARALGAGQRRLSHAARQRTTTASSARLRPRRGRR